MLTKKDYIKLAEIIREYRWEIPLRFVDKIVHFLESDNPNFKPHLFYQAAGYDPITGVIV